MRPLRLLWRPNHPGCSSLFSAFASRPRNFALIRERNMNSCQLSHVFDLRAAKFGSRQRMSSSSSLVSKLFSEVKLGNLFLGENIHNASSSTSRSNPLFVIKSSYANVYPDLDPESSQTNISTLGAIRTKRFQDTTKFSPTSKSDDKNISLTKKPSEYQPPPFEDLGLSPELFAAVQALELSKPTEIQALGIPAVLRGEDVVLASHTGSGKTLAYLIPIVQLLRRDELESGRSTKPKRPRALVLCPTRELAEQVLRVAKSLCHHARFRSAMISGGSAMRPQQEVLLTPLDLIVGTPGRILQHFNAGNLYLGCVRYLVLDEADTMFDQGFGADLRKILFPLRSRTSEANAKPQANEKPKGKAEEKPGFQTVMVTATITKPVQRLLEEEFSSIRHIRTESLHKRVSNARHDFLPVSGNENKLDTAFQLVESAARKGERIMLFCNTISSCRAVDHYLNENGLKTLNYHGEVPAEQRAENIEIFRHGEISMLKKSPMKDVNELKKTETRQEVSNLEADVNDEDESEEEEIEDGDEEDFEYEYENNLEDEFNKVEDYEFEDDDEDSEDDEIEGEMKPSYDDNNLNSTSKRSKEASQRFPVLVCTDLAARGLDLNVDHVIMFDFPHTPIDYLHRTGRTARNGAKGKITSLVTKRDELLASQIEVGLKRNQSIETLSGDRAKVEAMKKREALERKKEKASRNGPPSRGTRPSKEGGFKLGRSKSSGGLQGKFPRRESNNSSEKRGGGRTSSEPGKRSRKEEREGGSRGGGGRNGKTSRDKPRGTRI